MSKPGSDLDVGSLVSQIVTGTISGASASLSKHKNPKPAYGPPPQAYGAPAPPASQIELFQPPPLAPRQQPRVTSRPQKKALRFRSQATQYRPQATHPETPQQVNYEQVAAPAHYGNYGSYGVSLLLIFQYKILSLQCKRSESLNLWLKFNLF